ncbi:MAG: hypothetical protein AAGE13_09780 [Pseudomonadota bacterium]
MRLFGFVLFVVGMVLIPLDWRASADADDITLRPIGEIWFQLHSESLLTLQPAIERYVAEWLWNPVIQTVLELPAAPVLAGLGLLFMLISRILGGADAG